MTPTPRTRPCPRASSPEQVPPPSAGPDDVHGLLTRAAAASRSWEPADQRDVDHIVRTAARAAAHDARRLAEAAVEETRRGDVTDKTAKNTFAATTVAEDLLAQPTVGVIEEDRQNGLTLVAEPVGTVVALTPVTNPTSTTVFKSLLCLKTRNPVVFAFHPGAQRCSAAAARVVRDAAIGAGAPGSCIQWVEHPDMATTTALMTAPETSLVLATGGNAMVRAAYSSGHPAIGVGAGNVPAYVHASADVERAVDDVVASKSFDNGMICASEQSLLIDAAIWERAVAALVRRRVHLTDTEETHALERLLFGAPAGSPGAPTATLDPSVVGVPAPELARRAGFAVAPSTRVLAARIPHVGRDQPLSREKLCPVLALVRVTSTQEGIEAAQQAVELDGLGHTAVIHAEDPAAVDRFGARVRAVRILVNAPASLGAIGAIRNQLTPSLTLGCGAFGHTSISDNVTARHLIDVKHIARGRPLAPATA